MWIFYFVCSAIFSYAVLWFAARSRWGGVLVAALLAAVAAYYSGVPQWLVGAR